VNSGLGVFETGLLVKMLGDTDGRTLFVKQSSGRYLTVQVWDGLGWNRDDIVAFAAGSHINKTAKPGAPELIEAAAPA
jgi:hypothetical protein